MPFGGDTSANALITSLLAGEDFTIPSIDLNDPSYNVPVDLNSALYQNVLPITNEMLTTRTVGGSGTFDAIMDGFKVHLREEYDKGRITGAEYTKAWISLCESAMSNAVQFLLGKDAAFWSAVQGQAQAISARVQLAMAKVQYASLQLEAMTNRANYALTKLKLATEDVTYATGKYQIDIMLPLQQAAQTKQNTILDYQINNMLPAQLTMAKEQAEAQRAQTHNTRTDGVPITGLLGKQKDLYNQQIISYQRDSEVKAAKLFTDAWTVNQTITESASIPTNFTNTSLDSVLADIKANNNLG
jgi:hypothetical protein